MRLGLEKCSDGDRQIFDRFIDQRHRSVLIGAIRRYETVYIRKELQDRKNIDQPLAQLSALFGSCGDGSGVLCSKIDATSHRSDATSENGRKRSHAGNDNLERTGILPDLLEKCRGHRKRTNARYRDLNCSVGQQHEKSPQLSQLVYPRRPQRIHAILNLITSLSARGEVNERTTGEGEKSRSQGSVYPPQHNEIADPIDDGVAPEYPVLGSVVPIEPIQQGPHRACQCGPADNRYLPFAPVHGGIHG